MKITLAINCLLVLCNCSDLNDIGKDLKLIDIKIAKSILRSQCSINLQNCQEIDLDCLNVLMSSRRTVNLNGLKKITDEMAAVLSYTISDISLDGLKDISINSLKLLSMCPQTVSVSLGGLTTVNLEQVAQLKKFRILKLNAVTKLDKKIALELTKNYSNTITLNGITSIDSEIIKILSKSKGKFILGGLNKIDEEAAEFIGAGTASFEFGGINSLSDEAFSKLAECKPVIYFPNITYLTKRQSIDYKYMSTSLVVNLNSPKTNEDYIDSILFRGDSLEIMGVKRLTGKIAKKIAGPNLRWIHLPDLEELDPEVSYWLGKSSGYLSLPKLSNIDDVCASNLSEFMGLLDLKGLKNMSDELATKLSNHIGTLDLSGLEEISDNTAKILRRHFGSIKLSSIKYASEISFIYLCKIKEPNFYEIFLNRDFGSFVKYLCVASALSKNGNHHYQYIGFFENTKLSLDKLKNITLFKVACFAFHGRKVEFNLEDIKFYHMPILCLSDSIIYLDQIKELTVLHLIPLFYHNGSVDLFDTFNLSDIHYFFIAKNQGNIYFGPIEKLSDKAATFLSHHKSYMSLGFLKRISYDQAKILQSHKDGILLPKRILNKADNPGFKEILTMDPFILGD